MGLAKLLIFVQGVKQAREQTNVSHYVFLDFIDEALRFGAAIN